jgi:carboxyl-terminal processing protease
MNAGRAARLAFLGMAMMLRGVCIAQDSPPTPLTTDIKQEILNGVAEKIKFNAFVPGVDMSPWPEFLSRQREDIDAAGTEFQFARAVNAALLNFGISHIRLLSPLEATARRRSNMVGVGLVMNGSRDGLKVTSIYPTSPAATSGILVGDTITAIDGKPPQTVTTLTGEADTEVVLRIRRPGADDKEIHIKRKAFSTTIADSLSWDGPDVAVLRVTTFALGYDQKSIEQDFAKAAGAKFLIIDLRSNAGGLVANLRHFLSLLLPPATQIGTFVSQLTGADYSRRHGGRVETNPITIAADSPLKFATHAIPDSKPFGGKVAVLINHETASASEICAAALRDNLRLPLIGRPTAGEVLASDFVPLPHGYEIQIPIEDYVTLNGARLEGSPLLPDVEVSSTPGAPDDPAIDKAIAELKKASG